MCDRSFIKCISIHLHIEPTVVVDPDIVLRSLEAIDRALVFAICHGVGAALDGIENIPNKCLLNKVRCQTIEKVPIAPGFESAGVLCEPDLDTLVPLRCIAMQYLVGTGMRLEQPSHDRSSGFGIGPLL